jgi:urease accessory protein
MKNALSPGRFGSFFVILFTALLYPVSVYAHQETGAAGSFASGFMHPLTGPDHMLAMIAVGLWGGILGRPAIWLLPVTFPLVMAFGGVLGIRGLELPAIEAGIAISGIVLGLMVLFFARLPLWAAAVLVGIFGLFHGNAHGLELPGSSSPLSYSAGFVLSTGLLHIGGIVVGLLIHLSWGTYVVRVLGAIIAIAGVFFLVG